MRKITTTILAAVLTASVLLLLAGYGGAAEDKPSLYLNDDVWYKGNRYMLTRIYDEYYVPVSIFSGFSYIGLNVSYAKNEVLINNTDTGRYISFNVGDSLAMTDGGSEIFLKVYRLYEGEYYVPAEYVCGILGIGVEDFVSPVDGEYSLRLYDSSASRTFRELIEKNNPDALVSAEVTSETATDTAPPDTGETPVTDVDPAVTDEPPDTSEPADEIERTLYLVVDAHTDEGAAAALKITAEYGVRVTFIYHAELSAATVIEIYASGHIFALPMPQSGDRIAVLDEYNFNLARIIKTKTRAVADTGRVKTPDEVVDAAASAGYAVFTSDAKLNAKLAGDVAGTLGDMTEAVIVAGASEDELELLGELFGTAAASERLHIGAVTETLAAALTN